MPSLDPINYPQLYSNVQWEAPTTKQMMINIPISSGLQKQIYISVTYIQSVLFNVDSSSGSDSSAGSFETYYLKALEARGWKENDEDSAGGAQGMEQEFVNNGHYFRIGFRNYFKETGPDHPPTLTSRRLYIEYN